MSEIETPFDEPPVEEEEYAEEEEQEEEQEDDAPEEALGAAPAGGSLAMALGEAPDLGEVAEIVVLATSLGSIKRQFFSSKRVQHFLDCKGVVYFLIDTNRDLSVAMNLKDTELYKEWKSQGILRTIENPNSETGEPEVALPQVLVDGVVLGGENDLQELEEDGDLDWIFARAACPCCLHEKPPEASSCASCGAMFTSLIPAEVQASGGVQQMLQGYTYNSVEDGAGERLKERWASGLQQADFEWDEGKRQDTEGEAEE
ncbi:uncharacterized protein LOC34620909 [Cyclospora cayetanensis]|uniref:Uncharacterized protein n=2 Tax=Cyclospora cayetanensis TaxID=88456 RepID=A0A1D3CY30_9EIME|nr:uncharacterized protein LOC34620909 [Cyclospora cayetanensis]OEH76104.1 hypothetical protein cyc_04368 [Cyclospora cayetanensis]